MSNAVNLFLHQIILRGGIPFEVTLEPLPRREGALDFSRMTQEQRNAEIQKGWDSARAGRVVPAEEVKAEMERLFGV